MDADDDIGHPAALFRDIDLSGRASIAVAVSGGGDSMALLDIVSRHLQQLADAPRLIAVTVDHGLRPASRAEAAWVHFFCESRGIAHTTVCWEGSKPDTGIQAAAREMRYRLLRAATQAGGGNLLFTGHTLDDQLETLAMRRARAKDGAGLAGMAAATLFDRATWIVRPLLGVRRVTLRKYLRAREIPWIDDPSNEDPAYERVRTRAAMDDRGPEALDIRQAQARRRRTAAQAAQFLSAAARLEADGSARVDADVAGDWSDDAVSMALVALTSAVGGQRLAVGGRAAASLPCLCRAAHPGLLRTNLGRCVFERKDGAIRMWREWRNLPEIIIGPQEDAIWDGRYAIRNEAEELSFRVGPRRRVRRRDGGPAAHARDAEPEARLYEGEARSALRQPNREEPPAAAIGRALRFDRYLPQFDHFLPEFDIELADAVARLFGRDAFPNPPVHRNGSN